MKAAVKRSYHLRRADPASGTRPIFVVVCKRGLGSSADKTGPLILVPYAADVVRLTDPVWRSYKRASDADKDESQVNAHIVRVSEENEEAETWEAFRIIHAIEQGQASEEDRQKVTILLPRQIDSQELSPARSESGAKRTRSKKQQN